MVRESVRPASRSEAKQRSRERLLDAALALLDHGGESALTTTAITAGAGLSQSSFYVHFASVDELLRELVDRVWEQSHDAGLEASGHLGEDLDDLLRSRFRALIDSFAAHPSILRLVMRSRLDPGSPIGEDVRARERVGCELLVSRLAELGAPNQSAADRRRIAMVAQGMQAVTYSLAMGYSEGRYPDLDEIVDVLVLIERNVEPALRADPWPTASP